MSSFKFPTFSFQLHSILNSVGSLVLGGLSKVEEEVPSEGPLQLTGDPSWHSHIMGNLTFQTGGVKFNEEFCPAGCLHNGFDALKLYVGLVGGLGES